MCCILHWRLGHLLDREQMLSSGPGALGTHVGAHEPEKVRPLPSKAPRADDHDCVWGPW